MDVFVPCNQKSRIQINNKNKTSQLSGPVWFTVLNYHGSLSIFFFLPNVRVKIPYSLMFTDSNNFPVQFNPFAMLDLLVWCIYSFNHTMLVLFQFSGILSCAKYNQWEYQPSMRRELSGLNSARRVKYTRCVFGYFGKHF